MNKRELFFAGALRRLPWGSRLLDEPHFRVVAAAVCSLIINLSFAFYNGILGILAHSLLFASSAVYYLLLGGMRFAAVLAERKNDRRRSTATARMIGVLLIVMSLVFEVLVLFSIRQNTATVHGEIPMITIATYTFVKLTLAICSAVKLRRFPALSQSVRAIHAIRYTEVAISLLTMQRSMLVSFGEADSQTATVLNTCTGIGVCVYIFTIGLLTLLHSRKKEE